VVGHVIGRSQSGMRGRVPTALKENPVLLKSTVTALVALMALAGSAAPSTAAPDAAVVVGEPHAAAHAHNDYEHGRPSRVRGAEEEGAGALRFICGLPMTRASAPGR
jgi:hypothetical protein